MWLCALWVELKSWFNWMLKLMCGTDQHILANVYKHNNEFMVLRLYFKWLIFKQNNCSICMWRGQQLESAWSEGQPTLFQTWSCVYCSWNRYLCSWWNGWNRYVWWSLQIWHWYANQTCCKSHKIITPSDKILLKKRMIELFVSKYLWVECLWTSWIS